MSKLIRRDERGAVLLLTALMLVTSTAMGAFILDLGNARQQQRQEQAAADAASLAGAQDLATLSFPSGWSTVISDVETYANENLGIAASAWTNCTDSGHLTYTPDSAHADACISANSSTSPTTLRVRPPAVPIPTGFAGIVGIHSISVAESASAVVAAGTPPCILCLLGTSGMTLKESGTATTVLVSANGSLVSGPGVYVDSSSGGALQQTGSLDTITAPAISVVGTATHSGAGDLWTPTPTTGAATLSDPLANLPVPSVSGYTAGTCPYSSGAVVISASLTSCTLYPGVYTSIQLKGTADSITLEPGTYVITSSPGIKLSGSGASLTGAGVTLYFACSSYPTPCTSGQTGGLLDLSASGVVFVISPPTTGTYQGLSIFYDRNNAAAVKLTGSSADALTGTIYAASSALTLSASASGTFSLNSEMVVGSAALTGSASSIDLLFTTADNVPVNTMPELDG